MDAVELFHPLLREWFYDRFSGPTSIQEKAWEAIAAGDHVLLSAPTGGGKTLAAFLWSINALVRGRLPLGKTVILYVSPLKALNNDVYKNLTVPLKEISARFAAATDPLPAITVMTRSGDTPQSERRRMRTRPPEILITTPESLNVLLTSGAAFALFSHLAVVILDEIHAVIESKRGTHLVSAVERLTLIAGEFQRISLSATARPLPLIAAFSGGFLAGPSGRLRPRPVTIISDPTPKRYLLHVSSPHPEIPDDSEDAWWSRVTAACLDIIEKNRSTLFFAASRKKTEKLARLLNEKAGTLIAYSHHGALSREIRLSVEELLKEGKLKAIVATGTLELGIDIGALDEVVLVQAPHSVSQAVQRIGRAGHQVGGESRGTLLPLDGLDFLHLAPWPERSSITTLRKRRRCLRRSTYWPRSSSP